MRIGVISDSHGDRDRLAKAVKGMGSVDVIFHLGDYLKDVELIRGYYSGELYVVQGNCDLIAGLIGKGFSYPVELTVDMAGKKIFITHGHTYKVKDGLNGLYYKGKEIGADIILFGHTHCAQIIRIDDMVMLNPGSVFKSKNNLRSTYGIIEIANGEIKPEICEI